MQEIHDETETDLVNLRRTIYLTIQSSMQADEAAHKLMKLQVLALFYHHVCCLYSTSIHQLVCSRNLLYSTIMCHFASEVFPSHFVCPAADRSSLSRPRSSFE